MAYSHKKTVRRFFCAKTSYSFIFFSFFSCQISFPLAVLGNLMFVPSIVCFGLCTKAKSIPIIIISEMKENPSATGQGGKGGLERLFSFSFGRLMFMHGNGECLEMRTILRQQFGTWGQGRRWYRRSCVHYIIKQLLIPDY